MENTLHETIAPATTAKPFYDLCVQLFDCVRDHDFDTLASICDDDFGIVDLNTEGKNVVVRDRAGWEAWFRSLFGQLKKMDAKTWTEITGYDALETPEMGYSVVDFDQKLVVDGKTLSFSCVTTIIWKKTASGWKESRYHCSLLDVKQVA